MRLTAEQFLERPPAKLAAFYAIHGAEPLAALEAGDALRTQARAAGYIEREVFTAESGFDWSKLKSVGSELSLFATLRLLEIRIPTGKPGREGGPAIEQFCQRLPDDTITIVFLPEIDWQVRKSKWFTTLESTAVMIEATAVDRERLPQWLKARLARQAQSANTDALEWLADRVEGNLLAARQELRKLELLCPPGEISRASLEDSVADVSRFNPFQLVSAIHDAAGDDASSNGTGAARIQRMLDGLKAEGDAPPLILWIIANEIRSLARVRGATRSGYPPSPAKMRGLERLARRHTPESLFALLLQAAEIDRMIKGLSATDAWDALAELARGLAGKPLMKAA
jgi:DNA polymerase-3 subunit delta